MSLIRGKMPAVWQAKWIDPELEHDKEERQPASVLRRRFTVKSTENKYCEFTVTLQKPSEKGEINNGSKRKN